VATSDRERDARPTEIGVRELKNQASRILRTVQDERAEYVVTVRGKPVAVLRSFTDEDRLRQTEAEIEQELATMVALATEVAAAWKSPHTAVELVSEQRRSRAGD
jgi:prevent-host-death family protein